jgi:aminoacrylate peracid reductase
MTDGTFNIPEMGKPIGCYSHAKRIGPFVAIAGMAAMDAQGKVVGVGDIEAQTRHTLRMIEAALKSAGATMQDVIKFTVFLTDYANYDGMNAAFREFFPQDPPARATLKSELILPAFLIEIETLAVVRA